METNLSQKNIPNWGFWLLIVLSVALIVCVDSLEVHFLNKIYLLVKETVKGVNGNLMAIILAVAGWLVALWMQGKNIKQQLITEIKYDIYKQFVVLHKENQDALASFMAKTSTPFILMESSMISFDLKLKKEYKGEWIPYGEMECVFEGTKKWTSFVNELNSSYFDFNDKYIAILYLFDDWMAPIKNLYAVKESLVAEIDNTKARIFKNISMLQMYSVNNEYDWRKWNRDDVDKITKDIHEDAWSISCYLHDFMVLAHNELLSEYFEYSRPTRKTLDAKYLVLTKKGIVVNMETDKKVIEKYKQSIIDNEK
ncbi:MAG: hypothetical protein WC791_03620 [Candidatus Paceibacterota bacterium]|jgi:hypothetical protein